MYFGGRQTMVDDKEGRSTPSSPPAFEVRWSDRVSQRVVTRNLSQLSGAPCRCSSCLFVSCHCVCRLSYRQVLLCDSAP